MRPRRDRGRCTASRDRSRALAVERHPAVAHADDPVGVVEGQIDLVQHAQHGQALVVRQPAQQPHDLLRRLGVEARHRLVGQQHQRPLCQRPRDRDALRLTARQACRRAARRDAAARPGAGSPAPPAVPRPAARRARSTRSGAGPARRTATLASTLRRRTRLACCQIIARSSRARRSLSPDRPRDLGAVQPDLARSRAPARG